MAYRCNPFAVDEYYHCYSRGIDKRTTFEDEDDYARFIQILYACNDDTPCQRHLLGRNDTAGILHQLRSNPLVSVIAYCLMPNHFHLVLKETRENGISTFMQKLGTAYTMYFNTKQHRIGGLFTRPFRAKHIDNDVYLKHVVQYVHLNPAELFEPGWKRGEVTDMKSLYQSLIAYPYSSLRDYEGTIRPYREILDWKEIDAVYDNLPPLINTLHEAATYYSQLKW